MRELIIFVIILSIMQATYAFDTQALSQQYVNDLDDLLTTQQEADITTYLKQLERNSTLEFALVIVPSLEGSDVFSASFAAAEYLGVGKQDVDNGLLLFIAMQDREYFIQVGSGLEASLPDARVNRIGDTILTPAFQQELYYEGILDTLIVLASYAQNDTSTLSQYQAKYDGMEEQEISGLQIALIILFIIIFVLFSGGRGFMFFPPGSGRGGLSGGRSRGGFGGFGGGGFGGGGAGGRW